MNLKTRKEVIYSKVVSLIMYGSELYTGQTQWAESRVTSIILRCNRAIFRRDWFKVSNKKICKAISVETPDQLVKKSTLTMFHKLMWNQSPPQLFKKIKLNNNHRTCSKVSYINPPSKQVNKRTAIFAGMDLYNKLPTELKGIHPRKFKLILNSMKI